jgi:transposase-like protein
LTASEPEAQTPEEGGRQILEALRQAESGTPVVEICRKLGVTETTFYRWKKQYGVWTRASCGNSSSCERRTAG